MEKQNQTTATSIAEKMRGLDYQDAKNLKTYFLNEPEDLEIGTLYKILRGHRKLSDRDEVMKKRIETAVVAYCEWQIDSIGSLEELASIFKSHCKSEAA